MKTLDLDRENIHSHTKWLQRALKMNADLKREITISVNSPVRVSRYPREQKVGR